MQVADKFLVFNQPSLTEEEMSSVMDVIRSGWIGTGKVAQQFEEEFSEFMGGGYSVAVSSCSMGLILALCSLKKKGEVITSPLTFAATVNAIIHSGNTPIFVDVDVDGCLDLDKANAKVDAITQCIIPVHYSGTPMNISKINPKVPVVEDCAHSFGAKFIPALRGSIKVFSFYPNKNITSGEGGMIWTKSKAVADQVRILSSQGLSAGAWARFGKGPIKNYSVEKVGYKANMPDILAAIGLVQLRRWPEIIENRMKVWRVYEAVFGPKAKGHSTHFYPLKIKNRDSVRLKLYKQGIGTGIHYKPLHLEPAYKFLGYKKGDFPNAELWGEQELSLPVGNMTEDDAYRVVDAVYGIRKGRS